MGQNQFSDAVDKRLVVRKTMTGGRVRFRSEER
jgi:hypothetical protein